MKTGTQSAQDCAAVSLATPSGRKVCMNPLAQWLMPVALLALLLAGMGTAWGQDPTAPVTPPVVDPPVVTPPVVTPPITGTNGTGLRSNPRQDYRDYLSSTRASLAPAPRPVISVRPGMIDQSAANRILTNPRLALRLGLAGGGGGGRNSTNAVPNGGNGNPPPLVGVPNAPAPINAVPNLPQGGN